MAPAGTRSPRRPAESAVSPLRLIARAGAAFAFALVVLFALFATSVVTSLHDIDHARSRADAIRDLTALTLAASSEERIAFRDFVLNPSEDAARVRYETTARQREEAAARLQAARATPAILRRIATSEERFATWQASADALLARLQADPRAEISDADLDTGRAYFDEYTDAADAIDVALDTSVTRYRERLTRELLGALAIAGVLTVVGIGFTAMWLRSSLRATRELERSRHEIATAHAAVSDVSNRLQFAMLGSSASAHPDLLTAARYQPAERALTVGGDWYDILDLNDGTVACIIGDVVGHGVDAAATMGQLRALLAGLVLDGRAPGEALMTLDAFAARLPAARNATCAVGIIDPDRETLRWARAGHPPLLVVDSEGTATFLHAPCEPPLAVPHHAPRTTTTTSFPREATLVLYTDGLIERRGEPITVGLERLQRAAELGTDLSAAELCDHLIASCGDHEPFEDDVAVAVGQLLEHSAPQFSYRLPTDPTRLLPLRRGLHAWLSERVDDRDVVNDVVLAVDEVATNSIEHAYVDTALGFVTVTASQSGHGLEVRVVDEGTWRAQHDDPARGRGAAIARACMDDMTVERRPSGTTVTMRRSLPPLETAPPG